MRHNRLLRMLPMLMGGGAAAPWYLSGGIPSANCIAAYLATGVANIGASYANLANVGTYTLTNPGAAAVTWDATNGWKGVVNAYLDTGINATAIAGTWTILVRYTAAENATQFLFGSQEGSKFWFANPRYSGDAVIRYGLVGSTENVAPSLEAGIIGLAGNQPYRNGAADGAAISVTPATLTKVYITNTYGGITAPHAGYIQAAVIYDIALTAPQVAAVTAAMALL